MPSLSLATPYRDLLPPLTTEEREALRASIALEGVREPVMVDEEGNVLDGHHRLAIEPNAPTRVVSGLSSAEKQAFVFQANITRRNLSPSQKTEVHKRMKAVAKALREEAPVKNTQERVAALLGVSQQVVSKWGLAGDANNTTSGNACTPSVTHHRPDARVKVPPPERPVILERLDSGETQEQVAADYGITRQSIAVIATKERKQREATEQRRQTVASLPDSGIHHGDFRIAGLEVPDSSVDLIFTDPPYDLEGVGLYSDLAAFAARVLRPGGWCLAYSGQTQFPEALRFMTEHLEYGWLFAVHHSGGDMRFRKYHIHNHWKPIIACYKPPLNVWWDWFTDCVTGGREKDSHLWQQALSEAEHFIRALSPKGGLVCDPMVGSGTTCLAAKRLGRQWIAFEIVAEHVAAARERVQTL